ncbi:adenylate/guanylate cyclase domain-containing protein [Nocardia farcinica]|uniref:pH-sensitive adenylate cyclase Rv1264 n=3 Tax=Nocardia TaxID=1817 RepID=A0A0H5NW73_NOCFR|nr:MULTISPECIES: adenylate/guanylate cyclase domain-containing protein [Nocardia]AXK86514.1 adenylate/guanylate cyclase domain-containing protein [Nocardia farcinica]MBA4859505.1 adenylate/guanylate cyclase domain-containing protein [Nocardia farcinica]MBC9819589.1 adenylate/guanylate cyclase domain-containing protein [Nocardia farcinica]MBF6070637.1 adenylate/guanylate cyclase domain-containing protein [Nocardia farcinica]MBF6138708.1 adenylate/guanylate cyclase domain-containing protein [Noc
MASSQLPELVESVIESHLLGGERAFSRTEVAERSGVSAEVTRRLWTALGFPASPDESVDFTDADVRAVREFRSLRVVTDADLRRQSSAARTIGQAMARLAEWQADLVLAEIATRIAESDEDPAVSARRATEETISAVEDLQSYAWRRHLAAALARSLDGAAPGEDSTRELAVGFADMVGYTRLTRHLHPDELSTLLDAFESTTTAAITENNGWVIKNVGDEVMFAADTAADAARIALAIQESTMMVGGSPELRVAVAYGPVLQRFGDLYGSVVNIASRLTGVARPGTVLIDDGAAAELADEKEFRVRHLRSVRVRGFNRLRPHLLRRA